MIHVALNVQRGDLFRSCLALRRGVNADPPGRFHRRCAARWKRAWMGRTAVDIVKATPCARSPSPSGGQATFAKTAAACEQVHSVVAKRQLRSDQTAH